jgi:hypothetical protein
MSLNLHATVRGAIQSVSRDIPASYLASTGYTPNTAGRQVPNYAAPVTVQIQIQPPTSKDLRHMEFLNIQGTTRVAYLYSNPDAIKRVDAKGGDLLEFTSFVGDPVDKWLVAAVPERWNVGQNGLDTFSGVGSLAITSKVLTISALNFGVLEVGDTLLDLFGALPPNTSIASLGTGTGGVGTYNLSNAATANESGDSFIVTDTKGLSGWSKLYLVLQTDRP